MPSPAMRKHGNVWAAYFIVLNILLNEAATAYRLRHESIHRSGHSRHRLAVQRRSNDGTTSVSEVQLRQLQQYFTTFDGWITNSITNLPSDNPIAFQLSQEYTSFKGWVDAWFRATLGIDAPESPPASLQTPSAQPASSSGPEPSAASGAASAPSTSGSDSTAISTVSVPPPAAEESDSPASPAISSPDSNDAPSSVFLSNSRFNSGATNNLAVYWGSGPKTRDVGLLELCNDPNINIINLAFMLSFKGPTGYPQVDFGAGCNSYSPPYQCPAMASAIKVCQKNNKLVLLSIGGADGAGGINLASSVEAKQAANSVWNTFGAGTIQDKTKRPFGDVILDGFDIDNENKQPQYYTNFLDALRSRMDANTKKTGRKYYISAAPQCPFPDASIPLDGMQKMDFVWVQFYNNNPCNIGTSGFNIAQWSSELSKNSPTRPRVFIGAPACPVPECSGSGYLGGKDLAPFVKLAQKQRNFGGMMLWDGSRAKLNKDSTGKNYLQTVKGLLNQK